MLDLLYILLVLSVSFIWLGIVYYSMADSLPDNWSGEPGEASRPVTRESGYYCRWYYNEDEGFALKVDTAGGFGGDVKHVVNLYEAEFPDSGDMNTSEYPEHTKEFETDNQEDTESQKQKEEAMDYARKVMRQVNSGKFD